MDQNDAVSPSSASDGRHGEEAPPRGGRTQAQTCPEASQSHTTFSKCRNFGQAIPLPRLYPKEESGPSNRCVLPELLAILLIKIKKKSQKESERLSG
jgi:hypothetical protein